MASKLNFDPVGKIAKELSLTERNVRAVVALLSEDATVPFIARYRKEATGGLDEVQIRAIGERRRYLIELEDRRATVLESIEKHGKLTPALREKIRQCTTKAGLEDLYLPYKPKRRTRAQIARERGLEPLADRILQQPRHGDPEAEAQAFVDPERQVPDAQAALHGAMDIVAETMAENADIRAFVRDAYARKGVLVCKAAKAVSGPTKFEQYYDYSEPVAKIPSHRFLAVRRGEAEGVLRSHIEVGAAGLRERAARVMGLNDASPFGELMRKAIEDGYRRLLSTSVQIDVGANLKSRSDAAAVQIFADNLRHLLLASPLGAKPVIGIDPGFRTGCKCAAVDATGELLEHSTLYMHTGEAKAAQAEAELVALVERNRPVAVAVGNGTAGRDTEAFVRRALATAGHRHVAVVSVSEAGASVYSASEVGREELPELDLTVRGAVSIARRLQDPLAELVKIEPRSIGVGQYQHDVAQSLLERKLGEVVESCVNHVGVEINTASAPLLSYVAGLRGSLAKRIVEYRQQHGAFRTRSTLLKVAGLGPRTFEQAAGFLRIRGGAHPLDASAVHPERYAVVERMAQDLNVTVTELVGNAALVEQIDIARYANEEVGLGVPTLRDILSELEKPGRDPRAHFEPPRFRDDVHSIEDLEEGMLLQGVVTNVTAFGAFVDVGVHQDGLVHISELADRFVRDPREVAKVGDRLTVRVLSVDGERKRIGLSARLKADRGRPGRPAHRRT